MKNPQARIMLSLALLEVSLEAHKLSQRTAEESKNITKTQNQFSL